MRRSTAAAVVAVALAAAGLGGAPAASAACENPLTPIDVVNCVVPVTGTYSFNVALSPVQIPGLPGTGSGTSSVAMDAANNRVCATTTWTGIDPATLVAIHQGTQGQPPNPVPLVALSGANPQSGASACTLVAPGEIGVIVKCPAQFNVVVQTRLHPDGAIRGQLGSTCSI